MQKAIFKVYIKGKIKPIIKAEIYEEVEKTVEDFHNQLNDRTISVVSFGQLSFSKELYHHDELYYKD